MDDVFVAVQGQTCSLHRRNQSVVLENVPKMLEKLAVTLDWKGQDLDFDLTLVLFDSKRVIIETVAPAAQLSSDGAIRHCGDNTLTHGEQANIYFPHMKSKVDTIFICAVTKGKQLLKNVLKEVTLQLWDHSADGLSPHEGFDARDSPPVARYTVSGTRTDDRSSSLVLGRLFRHTPASYSYDQPHWLFISDGVFEPVNKIAKMVQHLTHIVEDMDAAKGRWDRLFDAAIETALESKLRDSGAMAELTSSAEQRAAMALADKEGALQVWKNEYDELQWTAEQQERLIRKMKRKLEKLDQEHVRKHERLESTRRQHYEQLKEQEEQVRASVEVEDIVQRVAQRVEVACHNYARNRDRQERLSRAANSSPGVGGVLNRGYSLSRRSPITPPRTKGPFRAQSAHSRYPPSKSGGPTGTRKQRAKLAVEERRRARERTVMRREDSRSSLSPSPTPARSVMDGSVRSRTQRPRHAPEGTSPPSPWTRAGDGDDSDTLTSEGSSHDNAAETTARRAPHALPSPEMVMAEFPARASPGRPSSYKLFSSVQTLRGLDRSLLDTPPKARSSASSVCHMVDDELRVDPVFISSRNSPVPGKEKWR